MLTTIVIIILILCILLAGIILIQNPKGGGLSSSIGGFSNQTMGVKRTTETLEKTTWYLMGFIAFLVLLSSTRMISGVAPSSDPSENTPGLDKNYPGDPASKMQPATDPAVPAQDNLGKPTVEDPQDNTPENLEPAPAENTPQETAP